MFENLNLTEEQIQVLEGEVNKKLQSETDRVRTEYSKKIKAYEEELIQLRPKTLTEEEKALQEKSQALENKEKELMQKEKLSTLTTKLQDQGLPQQLSKYLIGVEDVETEISGLKEMFNGLVLDNSFKPNNHTSQKEVITKEQFKKMSYIERLNLFNSNEELFKKLSN